MAAVRSSINTATRRLPKKEGTIADVFASLTSESPPLPTRFSELKKQIFSEKLVKSWREVLDDLKVTTEAVAKKGADIIPRIQYTDVVSGLSGVQRQEIKKVGAVIVKGGVPKEEALAWKQSIRDYAQLNSDKVKGIPPDNIVFYEIYNSRAQTLARTHPALINTQRALLSLWHTSDPATPVSFSTPMSYFDRLRIRPPGPSVFTLGPHIDGGSLERWEDPTFRACFRHIFSGDWRNHDPFDASFRTDAKQDLYNASSQCSVFRPWQGWTSLSTTGPREGTLRLLPFLSLSTAYLMLRPFFRLRPDRQPQSPSEQTPLEADAWEVDLESPAFPGSEMGKAQQLTEKTHPHLRLDKTITSIPTVEPGDQVYWHCDMVHAVEAEHTGAGDSSVLYIPAVPLTARNAEYLYDQLANFKAGIPPPDFGGGEGEMAFKGRSTVEHVKTLEGRQLYGLSPYDIPNDATAGAAEAIKATNAILQ